MRVKISISTFRQGERSEIPSVGELRIREEGFAVRYFLEGDECLLEFSRGTLTQRRSGSITFSMSFTEGEQTSCVLEECGRKFEVPVFTNVLGVSLTDEGCTVSLVYRFAEEEQTELVFTASAIK